jgi:hypothetical protein
MLDFPALPVDGQLYPAPNGVTYQYHRYDSCITRNQD